MLLLQHVILSHVIIRTHLRQWWRGDVYSYQQHTMTDIKTIEKTAAEADKEVIHSAEKAAEAHKIAAHEHKEREEKADEQAHGK